MTIEQMLQATVKAGGSTLKLVPGRRVMVGTAQGDREVKGGEQTGATIARLLEPILPAGSVPGTGQAPQEWTFQTPLVGQVLISLEATPEGQQATLRLAEAPALQGPAPALAPVTSVPIMFPLASAEEAVPADPPSRPASHEPERVAEIAFPVAAAMGGPSLGANGTEVVAMEELLCALRSMGASDLHMSVGAPPMVRVDGDMTPVPGRAALSACETERLLLAIAPERNRQEFARRHDTDFAYEIAGIARFRANLFMDRKGVGGVFRIIPSKIMTAEEMGLPEEVLDLCHLPKGLVLVTGPTGSGKSTTLAALVDYVNRTRADHIVTIEDPLEFVHDNKRCLVNQRQVGEHTDSFKDALRAALREDPDVVLVGEMRDLETVAIAIETAETGHLVFGTLHTSSAPSTVDRIIDQFPADRQEQIRTMLSESLKAVISQTLCKRIGGGRVPAFEILISLPSVANLIRESKVFQIPSIMQTGKKAGMCLMNESLLDLVKRNVVEPREAWSKAVDKAGLTAMLRRSGIETPWLVEEPEVAATR